jgi:hypothetical protein
MDEQAIRLLVRQAIARHLGPAAPAPLESGPAPAARQAPVPTTPAAASDSHPAAIQFFVARPAGETHCIIEPAVTCNHCGYCQCYGH